LSKYGSSTAWYRSTMCWSAPTASICAPYCQHNVLQCTTQPPLVSTQRATLPRTRVGLPKIRTSYARQTQARSIAASPTPTPHHLPWTTRAASHAALEMLRGVHARGAHVYTHHHYINHPHMCRHSEPPCRKLVLACCRLEGCTPRQHRPAA
jgi:hypothetical protein